jgi:hypothetical protein
MRSFSVRLVLGIAVACALAAPVRAEDFDPTVARRIKPEDVVKRRAAGEKPIILDTRGVPTDVVARGAALVPNAKIEEWAKDVPKNAFIVTYCT